MPPTAMRGSGLAERVQALGDLRVHGADPHRRAPGEPQHTPRAVPPLDPELVAYRARGQTR
ncbi:hypothetical protein ABZT27_17320 [Streptomyces sp. NPDC005389]|uniref:hypothetical protein n=1 Tax=Streptomyces sp. NPDC005389 TaxID=3157040 RepID=UPI0033BBB49E